MKKFLRLLFLWLPGSLLLLYALTGFWLIPALVEKRGPDFIRQMLGADASMGTMRFNPFTMTLEIDDFRLKDSRNEDLFTLREMAIDFAPISTLFNRTVTFEKILFEKPRLHVVIDKTGEPNFSHILRYLGGVVQTEEKNETVSAPTPESGNRGLPPMRIDAFEILDASLVFDNLERPKAVHIETSPTSFALYDLSTLKGAKTLLDFQIRSKKGGTVRIAADFSLQPLTLKGKATIDGFDTETFNQYLRNVSSLHIESGRIDFNLDFTVKRVGSDFDIRLFNGAFSLRNIHLADGNEKPIVLSDFDIEGVVIDPNGHTVEVASVTLADSRIDIRGSADGHYSFERWFQPNHPATVKRGVVSKKTVSKTSGQNANSPAAWKVHVGKLAMRNTKTLFEGPAYSYEAAYRADITDLRFDTAGALTAQIRLLQTGDISLNDKIGKSRPFRLKRLALEEGRLDAARHTLTIERIVIAEPATRLVIYKTGETNIDRLIKGRHEESTKADAGPADEKKSAQRPQQPFNILLKRFDFEKGSIDFEDRRFSPAVRLTGSAMTLRVQNLALPGRGTMPFQVSMQLPGDASFRARGEIKTRPLRVAVDAHATHLALQPYLPIVQQYLNIDIPTGHVDGNATIRYDASASPKTSVLFNTSLSDLAIVNRHNDEKIFSLKKVAIEPGRLELSPNALLVSRLVIDEPAFDIRIRKDRTTNLDHILRQSVHQSGTQKSKNGGKGGETGDNTPPSLDFAIAHILVRSGKGEFSDASLTIPFSTSIHDMNGDLIGLNNKEGNVAGARFEGVIERYGMMRARSLFISSDPRRDTGIGVAFRNLDITKVSPYISRYLGYEIADGRLWVNVDYAIREGRLKSRNTIVFRRLKLGKAIDSNESVGKGVKFALSLLTDSQGNIDLDIPIEGNMTNPSVNLGGVIFKALTHVVTKVVEAPFKLLGKMLGIGGAALQYVHFDPGSSIIEPTEKETLDALANVLPKKPEMVLLVPGVYEANADTRELRKRKLRDELVARLRAGTDKSMKEAMRSGSLLEKIYRKRAGKEALGRFKEAESAGREKDPKGYLQKLFDTVLETYPVDRNELARLAKKRAEHIVGYLTKAGVPKSQLRIADIVETEKLDRTGMIELKLGMERKNEKKK